jgi:hypothetical protein
MEKGIEKFSTTHVLDDFRMPKIQGEPWLGLRLALRQHPELSKLIKSWPHLPSSMQIGIVANGGEQRQSQMNNAR